MIYYAFKRNESPTALVHGVTIKKDGSNLPIEWNRYGAIEIGPPWEFDQEIAECGPYPKWFRIDEVKRAIEGFPGYYQMNEISKAVGS